MPYEKHEWQTGETITASKLNALEDGVAEASEAIGDESSGLVKEVADLGAALEEKADASALEDYLPLGGGTLSGDLNINKDLNYIILSVDESKVSVHRAGSRTARTAELDGVAAQIVLTLSARQSPDFVTVYDAHGVKTSHMAGSKIEFPEDEDFSDEQNHIFATREWATKLARGRYINVDAEYVQFRSETTIDPDDYDIFVPAFFEKLGIRFDFQDPIFTIYPNPGDVLIFNYRQSDQEERFTAYLNSYGCTTFIFRPFADIDLVAGECLGYVETPGQLNDNLFETFTSLPNEDEYAEARLFTSYWQTYAVKGTPDGSVFILLHREI